MDDLRHNAGQAYLVNGKSVTIGRAEPTARELLVAAHLNPPSEHLLIAISKRRTRFCPHEDFLPEETERYRAFEGDRMFAFTVDEISQVWGEETATVDELLEIFEVDADHELVLERDGEPDVVLTADGEVKFGPDGVEDLVTRPRRRDKITVSVHTTAGVFPSEGVLRVNAEDRVADILKKAAKRLRLPDTTGWVVSAGGRDINLDLSFEQNGLTGDVVITWNAPEGGGGHA